MFDTKKVTDECINWISDLFEKNVQDGNAVIGISGGKDRVIGVLMPSGEQSDIQFSYDLVNHLGIKHYVVNIGQAVKAITEAMPFGMSVQAVTNLPPRIRMSTLYAVSQSHNGRVVNTCNLSEDWVGYSTRYGDAAGDFSPMSNLTVAEVKEIGRYLGLPSHLVDKPPIDGLCGKTDEDNLGFTYAVLDEYLRTGHIEDADTKAKIDAMHERNKFKLELMPSFKPDI